MNTIKVKRKSKFWSNNDIKTMSNIITTAISEGKDKKDAVKLAALHFNVTPNSVSIKYGRILKGILSRRADNNTTKEPIVRKKGIKIITKSDLITDRTLVFNIKNYIVDLKNNKLTIHY